MRMLIGWLVVVALAAALFVVLFDPFSDDPTAGPTPSETLAATTTPSPTPSLEPLPLPTGDNFEEIVQAILDIEHAARARLDESLLELAYDPNCNCLAEEQAKIAQIRDGGRTVEEPVGALSGLDQVQELEPGVIEFLVKVRLSAVSRVLHADGSSYQEAPPGVLTFHLVLRRGDDGLWRKLASTSSDFAPDAEEAS